jgi:hypothetical protein
LELSEAFRARVRAYPRLTRGKIGRALQQLERDFGQPHLHGGLGIRRLTGSYFEVRVGLDLRLIFENREQSLPFVMVGNHDEVRKFLRGL